LRLGVLGGTVKREVDTGTLPFPVDSDTITLGAYSARLIFDQLDSVHFPRDGWKFDASYLKSDTGLGADDSYTKWECQRQLRPFLRRTYLQSIRSDPGGPFRFETIAGLRSDFLGWIPGAVRPIRPVN
jgi:outer membrane translocation and assembly module TamA